jgi:hypothetical protein
VRRGSYGAVLRAAVPHSRAPDVSCLWVTCGDLKARWRAAFVFAISLSIGRIGCALAHDHPGRITSLPIGISLQSESARAYITDVCAGAGRSSELPHAAAPTDEGIVPWFYRTLRNAAIDRFRRSGASTRAIEAFAREMEQHQTPTQEMEGEICACVARLATTLKPEYAEALQEIDVIGTPVKAFAEQRHLSASNAGVRVFRAREALKKRVTESCGICAEHGCVSCTCQEAAR